MNSCVIMAQIISEPELRYTQDNTPLAQMLVEFPALRENDPPCRIKAVGWGNLGQEIQQTYHEGDRVVLVGRLTMNTIERPEGFKEKKAEFVISQIQGTGGNLSGGSTPAMRTTTAPTPVPMPTPSNVVPLNTTYQAPDSSSNFVPEEPETNLDEIPF